jgi:hypothetical protein
MILILMPEAYLLYTTEFFSVIHEHKAADVPAMFPTTLLGSAYYKVPRILAKVQNRKDINISRWILRDMM